MIKIKKAGMLMLAVSHFMWKKLTGFIDQIENGEVQMDDGIVQIAEGLLLVTSCEKAAPLLAQKGFGSGWKVSLRDAHFCKVEAEPDYFYGTLVIPDSADLLGEAHRMLFFVRQDCVLLVSEDTYGRHVAERLRLRGMDAALSIEKLLFFVFAELFADDTALLEKFEQELMQMEAQALRGQEDLFVSHMLRVRRQLLSLRGYYEQMAEVGRELEENENDLFEKKQLHSFGTISARAERLLHRCLNLIDYASEVRAVYQGQVDERQNRNMQFLTVVSTIFFPLTVITGWYGMNFEHMPELAHGYPYVAVISAVIVLVCIWIFKKKKIF